MDVSNLASDFTAIFQRCHSGCDVFRPSGFRKICLVIWNGHAKRTWAVNVIDSRLWGGHFFTVKSSWGFRCFLDVALKSTHVRLWNHIYIYTHTYTYMLYTYTHVNMSWVHELGILLTVIFFKCRVGTVPCRAFPKIRWLLWVGQTHGTHWTAIITCRMIAGYVSFAVSFPRHSQQVNKKVFLLWISVSGFVETSIKRRCFFFPLGAFLKGSSCWFSGAVLNLCAWTTALPIFLRQGWCLWGASEVREPYGPRDSQPYLCLMRDCCFLEVPHEGLEKGGVQSRCGRENWENYNWDLNSWECLILYFVAWREKDRYTSHIKSSWMFWFQANLLQQAQANQRCSQLFSMKITTWSLEHKTLGGFKPEELWGHPRWLSPLK